MEDKVCSKGERARATKSLCTSETKAARGRHRRRRGKGEPGLRGHWCRNAHAIGRVAVDGLGAKVRQQDLLSALVDVVALVLLQRFDLVEAAALLDQWCVLKLGRREKT